jgi:hypothetical protein
MKIWVYRKSVGVSTAIAVGHNGGRYADGQWGAGNAGGRGYARAGNFHFARGLVILG